MVEPEIKIQVASVDSLKWSCWMLVSIISAIKSHKCSISLVLIWQECNDTEDM